MLSLLHIENIAVIQSADISFGPGMNVLTGETGAGKSIVVDAISAVIGQRVSREMIRTGSKTARVEAVFSGLPPLPWLSEHGVAPDENGDLLVVREIQADGKNVCRAGGRLVTVAQLRGLGEQLVNIHGQHDGQQLLDETTHLGYLDRYGRMEGALSPYRAAYQALSDLRRKMQALRMDEAEKARRSDTLTYQIGELERAQLQPGEEEALLRRRTLLRSLGKLTDAVEQAGRALSGDEDSDGAAALLAEAGGALLGASALSAEVAELADKAAELHYMAEDLAERVRDLRAEFDAQPDELDSVESRLDTLYRLKKKYGGTVEEMLDYLARCQEELDSITGAEDTLKRLEREEHKLLARVNEAGAVLSAARRCAAAAMEKTVCGELADLDMPKVRFLVDFIPLDAPEAAGLEGVQFLLSANVGEEPRPIQKVASGGELARIMLALKNVLAADETVTTLIFDEVDTGVSGRAAHRVALKMAQVAEVKQVLCVTHLPQIAAMADAHYGVEKGVQGDRTYTQVTKLEDPGRIAALARLTGGDHLSPAILAGAEELLREAQREKGASRPSI